MGFPSPAVTYPAENLSGLKIFRSLSPIDWELLPFDLWSGILLFLFYCSFLYFFFFFLPISSFFFSSPSPIPFFGKLGFSILFALPWGDSAVLCFGEGMRIPFLQANVQKGLRLCFNGVFYRGNPILISGAKEICVSRCRFRAELSYYSIRHAWQWSFENNMQN